jgi:CheY-like chemotaxis protein
VLLAEDNPINQMLARKVLEKMSLQVVVAPNAQGEWNWLDPAA